MGGWDALEGKVHGSVRNRCQGGEWEVRNDGVGENHGGDNEYAEIVSWDVFGWAFPSHMEDQGEKKGRLFISIYEIYK